MILHFDNKGKLKGSSSTVWGAILSIILIPLGILLLFIIYPLFFWLVYSTREEQLREEEENPDRYNDDTWYPWHRNNIAYVFCLFLWLIVFIMGVYSIFH